MSINNPALKAAIWRTLAHVGAHKYTVLRPVLDANGQPTEDPPAIIGTLFAVGYAQRQRYTGGITIDLPGMVLSSRGENCLDGLLIDGAPPQAGDLIRHGERTVRVTGVSVHGGFLQCLTLEEAL